MTRRESGQLILFDDCTPCPYLDGQIARLPLRWPIQELKADQLDRCLAAGDRRSGVALYRTACPLCRACEAQRLQVSHFHWGRSARRTLRRGDQRFEQRIGPPQVDAARVALFNRHRRERGLNLRDKDLSGPEYESFLVHSCCESLEFSYFDSGRLVAASVADRGETSLSAVYCYFDPRYARFSPGTYSILKQLEYCKSRALRYLYLGFYIADSPHMSYKSRFRPHQRFIDGRWRHFE